MNAPRIDWRVVESTLGDLTGLPFVRGARGPCAFDCWGLVLEVRRRLGLPLPPDFASHALPRAELLALFRGTRPPGWRRGDPSMGCIVLAPDAGHAGAFVASRVMHAQSKAGVVAWTLGHWTASFGELECWEVAPRG